MSRIGFQVISLSLTCKSNSTTSLKRKTTSLNRSQLLWKVSTQITGLNRCQPLIFSFLRLQVGGGPHIQFYRELRVSLQYYSDYCRDFLHVPSMFWIRFIRDEWKALYLIAGEIFVWKKMTSSKDCWLDFFADKH